MIEVEEIVKSANALGACKISRAMTDWQSAVRVMFSPQGREFCADYRFPALQQFRQMPNLQAFGVFVDKGEVSIQSQGNICVVGDTLAAIHITDNTKAHHIIVMHGAKAEIFADNYAVVDVVVIGGNATVVNKNNAKVLIK